VEAYQWLDFVRLAAFYDGRHQYEFAYRDGERTPFAMRRDDGEVAGLFYDQVGSLRVVADVDDNVIKEVLYDPFGGIIEDTNPSLRLPIGFAGGLHDRDLGFVRFGWRDYDVRTGRWTAPDPIGDKGGDPDWYGYCLDDPVNSNDPLGLWVQLAGPFLRAAPTINKIGREAADVFLPPSGGVKDVLLEAGTRIWENGIGKYDQRIEEIQEGRFGKRGEKIDEYYNQTWKK
jgi:RHS repeat-associated protein